MLLRFRHATLLFFDLSFHAIYFEPRCRYDVYAATIRHYELLLFFAADDAAASHFAIFTPPLDAAVSLPRHCCCSR